MKSIRLFSRDKKEVNISSEDIKGMIEGFESVQDAVDISSSMTGNILSYDVTLNSSHIEEIINEQNYDLGFSLDDDEESEEVLYEQAEYIGDAIIDALKEFIEDRYDAIDFESAYDVYKADLDEGIALTLTLSFEKIKHAKLYELASSVDHSDSNMR